MKLYSRASYSRGLSVAVQPFTVLLIISAGMAQNTWQKNGLLIAKGDLPVEFAACLQKMGGRLMTADKAAITMSGMLTDASGSQSVQITVQAPGYLRFQDGNSRVLTYNGVKWQSKNGKGGQNDSRIEESVLAHLPDAFLLQLANGGAVRRIGGRFRTDNGKTPNYAGPYWSLYGYSPNARPGLALGQPLQQSVFVALDESTLMVSEIRIVVKSQGASPQVTQTKFTNWFQQAGQWYPGAITRVENGLQTLQLTVQQASTGPQAPTATFEP